MLRAENIRYSIGAKTILDDVCISVETGELVALVGPNGAGKSTLLRVLSGETRPSSGVVKWLGRPIADRTAAELARLRAFLPQSPSLTFPFRVREVVSLGRMPHRQQSSAAEDARIVDACIDLFQLHELAERSFPTLSGGEKQRVHWARVFAQLQGLDPSQPRLLLLDEPTSNLDLFRAHRVLDATRKKAAANTAVIAVVHDLPLAAQIADRVVVLGDGEALVDGPPHHALCSPVAQQTFGMRITALPHPESDRDVLVCTPMTSRHALSSTSASP